MKLKYFTLGILGFLLLTGFISSPVNAYIVCWECNPVTTRGYSYTWQCFVGGQVIDCVGECDRTTFDICCEEDEGWLWDDCDRWMTVEILNHCHITDPFCLNNAICPTVLGIVTQVQCRTDCDLCD